MSCYFGYVDVSRSIDGKCSCFALLAKTRYKELPPNSVSWHRGWRQFHGCFLNTEPHYHHTYSIMLTFALAGPYPQCPLTAVVFWSNDSLNCESISYCHLGDVLSRRSSYYYCRNGPPQLNYLGQPHLIQLSCSDFRTSAYISFCRCCGSFSPVCGAPGHCSMWVSMLSCLRFTMSPS